MKSILVREIKSFFGSATGYLVIAVFLLLNGLFLWVFEGEFNILKSGFADLSPFFTLAPWILIFLIPAVTMRSLSDERRLGTLELLLTRPIGIWQIVGGKFLGAFALIVLALVPTLVYVAALHYLGMPSGNLDLGSTTGSYLGLLLLVASYTSVGIFASSLTDNQIVAFILAILISFTLYYGFEGMSQLSGSRSGLISSLGMESHFRSIGRGVIDTRDVIYFLSLSSIFLALTVYRLKSIRSSRTNLKGLIIVIVAIVGLNLLSSKAFTRFDLTQDKRYTLSKATLDVLSQVGQPLYIDVFLKGEFPGEFKRLQTEVNQLMEELRARNRNIVFEFVDPLENQEEREAVMQTFLERGLTPISVTLDDRGKQTQETVFPWAIATFGDRSVRIPLLKNMMGASTEEKVISSVQHLEYAFANGIHTVSTAKEKKVAVIKGNGQLHDILIADFVKQVRENYFIGPFTLDSVAKKPNESLEYLKRYDLAIIAKPTERFSDQEKLVLDQFIVGGGKTLWLIDQVNMEMDSLYNDSGASLAYPNDLNLNDMFFKYGFRINPVLVKDIMATPVALASGDPGSGAQYTQYPWFYAPLAYPSAKHPVVANLDGIRFDFANAIEPLKNNIDKTVLLSSSPYSKAIGTPVEVSLEMVQERPGQEEFKGTGNIPLALLLEGNFSSMYQNRVLPFKESSYREQGKPSKMIVVADGDVIRNQLDKNYQPLELGYDKWTGNLYANKEFLMNCVNYLFDDNGLIGLRSKEVSLPLLDKERTYEHYTTVQVATVGLPIVVLLVFGFVFTLLRSRKYGR